MTIAICDDMQADARRLHKQLERIVPGSEIRIFKSGELLLEELEKKRKPYDAIFVNVDSKKVNGLETIRKIREKGNVDLLRLAMETTLEPVVRGKRIV